MARTLLNANAATGTGFVIYLVAVAFSQFYNGFFGASSIASIAFKTVATTQAPLGFVAGIGFRNTGYHFIKIAGGLLGMLPWLYRNRGFGLIPHVQSFIPRSGVFR